MRKWRPAHKCIYVISDINGCYESLVKIFDSILPLRFSVGQEDTIVLLGNYINYGPDSKKVIDLLIEYKLQYGDKFIPLMGINEYLIIKSLSCPKSYIEWLQNGGIATLKSYYQCNENDIPPYSRLTDIISVKHINFIKSLPSHIDIEDYTLFHGGVNLENLDHTTDEQYITDRQSSLKTKYFLSKGQKPLTNVNRVMVGSFNYKSKIPYIYQKYLMLGGSTPRKLVLFELNSFKCEMISFGKKKIYKHSFKIH